MKTPTIGRGAVALAIAWMVASCGSTPSNDATVLELVGFDDGEITQCDEIIGSSGEIDVVQSLCMEGGAGGEETPEPYTETFISANLQNNQQLDITINRYTIKIEGSGVPLITYSSSAVVQGRRCSNNEARSCASDRDCAILGAVGSCTASVSSIDLRLFDFTTKDLIVADAAPFGRTYDVTITLFGNDVVGGDWVTAGSISARFDSFNNCGCTLGQ